MIERAIDPLWRAGFWPAFTCGAVALAIALVLAHRRGKPVPAGGWLLAGALVTAAGVVGEVDRRLLAGLALAAAAAALLSRRGRWVIAAGWAVIIAGGTVATARLAPERPALWTFAVAVTVALAAAFTAFDRHSRHRALGLPLLCVTAGGIYSTVPDTEQAILLLALTLPLAVAGWPLPVATLGHGGALVAAVALGWVVTSGGVGRPGSVAGAFAAAGILAADPLARLARRGGVTLLDRLAHSSLTGAGVLAVQVGLALAAGRVAGLRQDLWPAAVIGGAVLVAATMFNVLPARRHRAVGPGHAP